jgi:hypothetical protein
VVTVRIVVAPLEMVTDALAMPVFDSMSYTRPPKVPVGATVTVAVALMLFAVRAVIVAAPTLTPVTTPLADTVAIVAALLCQVSSGVGEIVMPAASFTTAVSVCVAATPSVVAAGLIVMVDGTCDTVIVAVPAIPFAVRAVMMAEPRATAVTSPDVETLATAGVSLVHVSVGAGVIVAPDASFTVGVSCCVAPALNEAVAGASVTDAGSGETATVAVADMPLAVRAVMVALPVATPVTTPLVETVATAALSVLHVNAGSGEIATPAASRTVGVSDWVPATASEKAAGDSVTDEGTAATEMVAVPTTPLAVVAEITADPPATAVATPLADTEAMVGALLVHVSVGRGAMATPAASRTVGVKVCVPPTDSAAEPGVRLTVAGTGATTEMVAEAWT